MADLKTAISEVQKSVGALLKLRQTGQSQYNYSWGSAFCVVNDRYVVTAFHVLNDGQARDPNDKFYVITVPGNGGPFFIFPVVSFPLERPDVDIALLEVGPCANGNEHLPAIPVSFADYEDGTRVVTVGFPAPEVHGLGIDAQGVFRGGQFFLKAHANDGIVAAHYQLGGNHLPMYEFNVGWHHGESGGPVVNVDDEPAAFTLMQHYRNIQGPHGILPGPHRGCSLSIIQQDLIALGATVV